MAAVNVSSLPFDYLNADQGPKVDAITITCFSLAVVAVCLRFLARILTKATLWWDDWTVLGALVSSTARPLSSNIENTKRLTLLTLQIFATGPLSLTIFCTFRPQVILSIAGAHTSHSVRKWVW